jgi:hypothetical protein
MAMDLLRFGGAAYLTLIALLVRMRDLALQGGQLGRGEHGRSRRRPEAART